MDVTTIPLFPPFPFPLFSPSPSQPFPRPPPLHGRDDNHYPRCWCSRLEPAITATNGVQTLGDCGSRWNTYIVVFLTIYQLKLILIFHLLYCTLGVVHGWTGRGDTAKELIHVYLLPLSTIIQPLLFFRHPFSCCLKHILCLSPVVCVDSSIAFSFPHSLHFLFSPEL